MAPWRRLVLSAGFSLSSPEGATPPHECSTRTGQHRSDTGRVRRHALFVLATLAVCIFLSVGMPASLQDMLTAISSGVLDP